MNDLASETVDVAVEPVPIFTFQDDARDSATPLSVKRSRSRLYKTILDYGLTSMILIPAAPFLGIVGILIKLDSRGPMFFRQPRYGMDNKVFKVWKFRTMKTDMADIDGDKLTEKNDPRITRLGAWLRKRSIDELPQLFNVITGDMSLVGPRPHPLKAKAAGRLYEDVCPDYFARHVIKPGITGWAQVNGWRGETTTEHQIIMRVKHDHEYIERQSLKFDLEILWLTIKRELLSKTAF